MASLSVRNDSKTIARRSFKSQLYENIGCVLIWLKRTIAFVLAIGVLSRSSIRAWASGLKPRFNSLNPKTVLIRTSELLLLFHIVINGASAERLLWASTSLTAEDSFSGVSENVPVLDLAENNNDVSGIEVGVVLFGLPGKPSNANQWLGFTGGDGSNGQSDGTTQADKTFGVRDSIDELSAATQVAFILCSSDQIIHPAYVGWTRVHGGGSFVDEDDRINGSRGCFSSIYDHRPGGVLSLGSRLVYFGKTRETNPSPLVQLHRLRLLGQLPLQDLQLRCCGFSRCDGVGLLFLKGLVQDLSLAIHILELPKSPVSDKASSEERQHGDDYSKTPQEHSGNFKTTETSVFHDLNGYWLLIVGSALVTILLMKIASDFIFLWGWGGRLDDLHLRFFGVRLAFWERLLSSLLCILLAVAVCLHALIIVTEQYLPHSH